MRSFKIGLFAAASIFVLFFAACTRPQADISKVTLTIPLSSGKSASQALSSSDNLNYVAINVTGPSMDPIFCSWDLESKATAGNPGCAFTPTSVTIPEVLNGNGRLFQVLMVYSQSSGSSMTFRYGSSFADLNSTAASINISPTALGGVQSGGHLSGRFFDGTNSGPSGLMQVKFSPGSGEPSMVVQQVEMYSGWFQAFTLETTPLDYVLNGKSLFGKAMTKADFVSLASSTGYASQVNPPAAGAGDYNVFGFFSDPTSASSATNLSGKTALLSSCTEATAFVSCLSADLKFAGPFQGSSTGDLLKVSGLAPSTISWTLLPGVTATSFQDSVSVYAATIDLTQDQLADVVMSRGFNCSAFASKPGVQLLGLIPMSATQQVVANLASMPTPLRPLVACPQSGITPLTAAAVLPALNNDGGCSNCKYLRLEFTSYANWNGDKYLLGKNGCYPMQAKAYRGQGVPSYDHTHMISMTLATPAWGQYYSDSMCASSVSMPTMNLSPGVYSSNETYWVRSTAPGTSLVMAATVSSDPSDGVISYQSQYNMLDVINPLSKVKLPTGPILTNTCYQGSVNLSMPDGSTLPVSYGSVYDNVVANTGVGLAIDPATCASSVSGTLSQSMNGSPLQSMFWFRSTTAGTVSVTAAPTSFDTTFATATAISDANLVPIHIKLTPVSSPLLVNQCNEFLLEVVNSNGNVIPAPNAFNVNFKPEDGLGFWSITSNCMTPSSMISIPVNASGQTIFFYAMNAGVLSGQFTADNGATPTGAAIPAITTPTDASGIPWVTVASRPYFPHGMGNQIGSHNFPVTVGLQTSSSSTLKCATGYAAPDPSSASWGDCGGRLVGNNLSFGVGDLSYNATYIMATKGKLNSFLTVGRDQLFGSGAFNVMNCGATISAGQTFDDINTALAGNQTVCLSAGTFGAGTANSISLPMGGYLLGKIDTATAGGPPASIVTVPAVNGGVGLTVQSLSGSVYISNIKFDFSGSATGMRYGIYSNAGTYGTVYTYGNFFDGSSSTGGATTGIFVGSINALALDSTADNFKPKAISGAGVSNGVSLSASGVTSNIRGGKFSFTSSATSSDGSVALSIASPVSGATAWVNVTNSEFIGDGGAIRAIGQPGAGSNSLELSIQGTFIQTNATSFANGYGLYVQDNAGTQIQSSKFVNAAVGMPAFKYYQASSGGGYSGGNFIMMESNVFQQAASAPAVSIGSASFDLTSSRLVTLDNNHFVKTGGGNSSPAIQGITSTFYIYLVRNAGLPGHGFNKACGSGANLWSSFYGGTSSIASSAYMWSPPSTSAAVYGGLCEFVP